MKHIKLFENFNDQKLIKVFRFSTLKIKAKDLKCQKMDWAGFKAHALSFCPYTDLNDPRIIFWKSELEYHHKVPLIFNSYYLDLGFNEEELTKIAKKGYGYKHSDSDLHNKITNDLGIYLTLGRFNTKNPKILTGANEPITSDKLVEIRLYKNTKVKIIDCL